MKARTIFSVSLAALVAAALVAPSGVAAAKPKKSGPVVVGIDAAGDWGANVDANLAQPGAEAGMDLVEASVGMADAATVNFNIKVAKLPSTGGTPEVARYVWSVSVDGNYVELDGKWTNYSRGACDPTAGSCPAPRDPGQQPFFIRGNCTLEATSNTTLCEELGIVQATFDAATGTITVPVPLDLIGAKKGSKIAPGTSSFTSGAGGTVVAIPAAFLSRTDMPSDGMLLTKTFTVPKK